MSSFEIFPNYTNNCEIGKVYDTFEYSRFRVSKHAKCFHFNNRSEKKTACQKQKIFNNMTLKP